MKDRAISELALAELDSVYRLACQLTRSPLEAEDYVQETYLRAFRYASSFTLGENGIRPWLFKILHNVIYNSSTRNQQERAILDELRQEKRGSAGDGEPAMVDCAALDWDSVDERLKNAIVDLPIGYRVVFLLSAVEGLKYRQIADIVEVPIGTVMSRLSRARSILAASLADLGAEHGLRRGSPSFSRQVKVGEADAAAAIDKPSEE